MERGHLGQYVITLDENLIFSSPRKSKGPKDDSKSDFTPDIYKYMDAALKLNSSKIKNC